MIKQKTKYRNYNELAKKYNCKMPFTWLWTKGVSSPIIGTIK